MHEDSRICSTTQINMAHLYKHKHHGWQIKYWVTFIDQTRKLKYKTAKDLQNAARIANDAKALENISIQGLTSDEVAYFAKIKLISKEDAAKLTNNAAYLGLTWDELETSYLKRFKSIASKSSWASYPYKVRVVVNYFLQKGVSPVSAAKTDIEAYMMYERSQGKAKGTCNKHLGILRIMLDKAVELGAITDNPARKVKMFKDTTERVPRILFPDEFAAFYDELDRNTHLLGGYFKELMFTYLYTGARCSELLRVKVSDVNIKQGYITIQETKNSQGRIVEIHPNLMPTINAVMTKNANGLYFFGGKDKPLCLSPSVTHAFMKLNVPDGVTLHSLRHTFITYMLQSGNDLKTVQKAAGHKLLSTTFRYTHFIPSKNTVSKIKYGN